MVVWSKKLSLRNRQRLMAMDKSLMLSFVNVSLLVSVFSESPLNLGNLSAIAFNADAMTQAVAQVTPATSINRPTLTIGSQGEVVSELQAALKLLGYYTDVVDGVYRESTALAVSRFQQSAGLNPDGIAGPATWNRLFPSLSSSGSSSAITPPPTTSTPPPTSAKNPASSFPVPSILQTTPSRRSTVAPEKPAERRQENVQPGGVATFPILRQGMRGPAVLQLQERLKALGFLQGAVDGVFGEATQAAVKAAQQNFNLEPDGVVGPATWSALLR